MSKNKNNVETRAGALHADDPQFSVSGAFWWNFRRVIHPVTLLCWIISSVLASLTGPFGTYNRVDPWGNLLNWLMLIGSVIFLVYFLFSVLTLVMGVDSGPPFYFVLVPLGSVTSGWTLHALLIAMGVTDSDLRPSFLELSVYVGLIMVIVSVVRSALFDPVRRQVEALSNSPSAQQTDLGPNSPATVVRSAPRLVLRLDLPEDTEILRVSADGHYVEVETKDETHRTRLRFSDALIELEGLEGVVTHRSHWVAVSALAFYHPHPTRPMVELKSGQKVPVSKSNRQTVEGLNLPIASDSDVAT